MTYASTCHCGAQKATVDGELPTSAITCNCSICRRKGHILHFVSPDVVTLDSDAEKLGDYTFNKHAIHHQFCTQCGCSPFGNGSDGTNEMVVINLRCVEACDLSALEISEYDGASL